MSGPPQSSGQLTALPPPDSAPVPYELDPYRVERVRGQLTYLLVFLVLVTLAALFKEAADGHWGNVREFAEVAIPVEAALLGSALTFYFTGH